MKFLIMVLLVLSMNVFGAVTDRPISTKKFSILDNHHYNWMLRNKDVNLTVYGEFLEKFPPEYAAEIIENTSWCCYHAIERWRSDCGCNTVEHHEWIQKWHDPFREAFDRLRDNLITLYEW